MHSTATIDWTSLQLLYQATFVRNILKSGGQTFKSVRHKNQVRTIFFTNFLFTNFETFFLFLQPNYLWISNLQFDTKRASPPSWNGSLPLIYLKFIGGFYSEKPSLGRMSLILLLVWECIKNSKQRIPFIKLLSITPGQWPRLPFFVCHHKDCCFARLCYTQGY